MASAAAPGDKLQAMGITADGGGLVFAELHRVPSTGELLSDAIVVYINGLPTRFALAPDLASVQLGRFAVVIAPAR